jgi:hypothetical protein
MVGMRRQVWCLEENTLVGLMEEAGKQPSQEPLDQELLQC